MIRRATLAALIAATACAPPPADDDDAPAPTRAGSDEVDVSPVTAAAQAVRCNAILATDPGGALDLRVGADGRRINLSPRLVEPAVVAPDGRLIVWTEDAATPGATVLRATRCDGDGTWRAPATLVDDGGTPNRIAVSPDGGLVAYVSTAGGLASVFVVEVDTGRAVQLTNRGAVRTPGRAPADFVPAPRDAPRFDGGRLVWSAGDSIHDARLP